MGKELQTLDLSPYSISSSSFFPSFHVTADKTPRSILQNWYNAASFICDIVTYNEYIFGLRPPFWHRAATTSRISKVLRLMRVSDVNEVILDASRDEDWWAGEPTT